MVITMSNKDLTRIVIEIIKRLGRATFDDLVSEIRKNSPELIDEIKLRLVVAELVRSGVLSKVPNPGRRKFEFTLSSRGNPEY